MRSWHRLINDFQDSKIIFFWPAILSRNSTAKSNLLGVGPQVFLENRTKTKSNHETIAFLDRALEVAGKHSVIYVAFGTMGTPGMASKIGFLFDALETSGLWVLFSHAWGEEELGVIIKERTERLGEKAMMASWVPQFEALGHPVGPYPWRRS